MISSDPTPVAKVFRKVMNPIHTRSVSSGRSKGKYRKAAYPEQDCIDTPMDACLQNERKGTCDSIAVVVAVVVVVRGG